MGVSGSGKTAIGRLLAEELNFPFVDADDHHPASNIEKMSQGIPLSDDDRMPWLDSLNQLAMDNYEKGCVIACSALKEAYRVRLMKSIESNVLWVYLHGSYDLILDRMNKRENHFMGANMLKSQFETLEEPEEAIKADISNSPEMIIKTILAHRTNEN